MLRSLRSCPAFLVLRSYAGETEVERILAQKLRFEKIFSLNLGVAGWYVINGKTEVGTVVAFVSGLNNVHDPWAGLVSWYEDVMVNHARYRTFVAAMEQCAQAEEPLAVA